MHRAIDFKDTLIVPKKSIIASRKNVNLTKKLTFKTKNKDITWEGVPIISSNMDTVSDLNTFNEFCKHNYITCFPKYFNKLWNIDYLDYPFELKFTDNYMLSCGINHNDYAELVKIIRNLKDFHDIDVKFICVDVANGYLQQMHDTCGLLRELFPDIVITAGNVVTPECIYDLIKTYGVNIIKIGIGSGMACETRLKTGVGYPQLQAILDCSTAAHEAGGYIISDGGIKSPCDIAKAFAGGADFVMAGGIFAGHDESPGKIVEIKGVKYKEFYGMSSQEANDRYNGGMKNYRTSEGKKITVPLKGPLENTIMDINGGLRSACTYVNANNLDEFYTNTQFVSI
jgi:GMP reductase